MLALTISAAPSDDDFEVFNASDNDCSCLEPWCTAFATHCLIYCQGILLEAFDGHSPFLLRLEII